MAIIKISERLAVLRKQKGLTQEDLAQIFGVTNQAVSKWESGASCPDISLLPDIADYFGISMDMLFGKMSHVVSQTISVNDVPWENDNTIRIVVYSGKTILNDVDDLSKLSFTLEGEARNVECHCNLKCGNIEGDADAGCDINCGDINGGADAGNDINCGDIRGGADAGNDIDCGDIVGGADAGNDIDCGDIRGGANAGNDINCKKIEGDVSCEGDVTCEVINGDVECGAHILPSQK